MRPSRHVLAFVAFALCCVTTTRVMALILRTPLPKPGAITKPPYDTRLTIKFRDDLKVRAVGGDLTSQVSADLGNVQGVNAQFTLSFQPMIQLPQSTLDYIETRAASNSTAAPCWTSTRITTSI